MTHRLDRRVVSRRGEVTPMGCTSYCRPATEGANVVSGAHVILYSSDATADRAFLVDILGTRHVDAGDGWLILKLPPAEIAVHPTDSAPQHELYLMVDDADAFVDELGRRGIEITSPVSDPGWGRLLSFRLPSGAELWAYGARHAVAHSLPD